MSFRIFSAVCLGSLVTVFSNNVHAQSGQEEFWTAVSKRPDVEIVTTKDVQTGAELKTAKFKGGVEISSNGVSIDKSGLGAVQCSWDLLIGYQQKLEDCTAYHTYDSLKAVDKAIQKTNQFMVDNSIFPITMEDMQQVTDHRKAQHVAKYECNKEEIDMLNKLFMSTDFERNVELNLSVPRPAVMEPCVHKVQ